MTEWDETRQEWVTWISIDEADQILDHEGLYLGLLRMQKILVQHNGETATPAPDTIAIQFNKKYV